MGVDSNEKTAGFCSMGKYYNLDILSLMVLPINCTETFNHMHQIQLK